METQIIITVAELGKFILWGAFLIILIYFLLILRKIYISIVDLTNVLKDHRQNIDSTLETLPGITHNFERITGEVASGMESFHEAIGGASKLKDKFKKKSE
jgi:large-conductance mechanosensitive channel